MSPPGGLLAVIPARGGSKGIPGKNLRPLGGLPLIGHSIRLAALCPEITRTIVSTDSEEIAEAARALGAEVPFLRPAAIAGDTTAILPVLQHALAELDPGGELYEYLLLLDPTSPGRLPEDIAGAFAKLRADRDVDGIVGVSEPPFNPIWHSVVERDGKLAMLLPEGVGYGRRQDVPRVFRINASLYIWRTAFLREERESWLRGRHLIWEIPDIRAIHIDAPDDLAHAEALLAAGLVRLPWLGGEAGRSGGSAV